jgi:hypothetical protein
MKKEQCGFAKTFEGDMTLSPEFCILLNLIKKYYMSVRNVLD